SDYLARSGTLKFAGGHKTRKVAVTIVGDMLDEANETFVVRLSNPVGGTIADGQGMGTITDNDAPPTVSAVATLTVPEGNIGDTPIASVGVTLSAPSGKHVSVDYTTVDGSATAGIDYALSAGTVNFAAGQTTASIAVTVTGDEDAEGDETFDVDLADPVNATLGTHPAVVTIQDNDPIPPDAAVLDVTRRTVREGSGGTRTLVFTVTRSGNLTTAVNVDYLTTSGTATAPSDFTSVSGNLAFAASATTATVTFQIKTDTRLEHRERFFLSLINPSAGAAILHGQASGLIRDDDTWTRFTSKKMNGQIRIHGRLSPAHPGKLMVVTLSRMRNGVWVRLGVRRPTLTGRSDLSGDGFSDSSFSTQFPRPNAGRCRIVAKFGGDGDHGPSQSIKRISC
ncbi:MAG TPA: Calx-beta domain-containing protein, partial [Candidatus Limnocylindria bacterium]|nr:Calx-beta domain-containing protein [Candidatus Limnocylindria bacterium]